jgi:hypothetical protein
MSVRERGGKAKLEKIPLLNRDINFCLRLSEEDTMDRA